MKNRLAYNAFISSIDDSIALRGPYGGLRWYISCSAETDAADTAAENATCRSGLTPYEQEELFYADALAIARMVYDCWQDYYPELSPQR
jgi:hypothetical protein